MKETNISLEDAREVIGRVCEELKQMLLAKNESYGNSALDPIRFFSRASAEEQLLVRIDDKLSRIARGSAYPGDNDLDDLQGYLTLLKVLRTLQKMGAAPKDTQRDERSALVVRHLANVLGLAENRGRLLSDAYDSEGDPVARVQAWLNARALEVENGVYSDIMDIVASSGPPRSLTAQALIAEGIKWSAMTDEHEAKLTQAPENRCRCNSGLPGGFCPEHDVKVVP